MGGAGKTWAFCHLREPDKMAKPTQMLQPQQTSTLVAPRATPRPSPDGCKSRLKESSDNTVVMASSLLTSAVKLSMAVMCNLAEVLGSATAMASLIWCITSDTKPDVQAPIAGQSCSLPQQHHCAKYRISFTLLPHSKFACKQLGSASCALTFKSKSVSESDSKSLSASAVLWLILRRESFWLLFPSGILCTHTYIHTCEPYVHVKLCLCAYIPACLNHTYVRNVVQQNFAIPSTS